MGRKGAEKEAGRRGRIGSAVMRKKRAGRKGVRKLVGRKGRQESIEIKRLEEGRKQKGRREWEVVAGSSKKGRMERNG